MKSQREGSLGVGWGTETAGSEDDGEVDEPEREGMGKCQGHLLLLPQSAP